MSRRPHAIWAAYNDTGALDVTCPHCQAQPGRWCTKDDGRVRRVPCIARSAMTGAIESAKYGRDFSEPTRVPAQQTNER